MATIRRVPSLEHTFQLVITRVYEDGDQELLEDEEESEYAVFMLPSFISCFLCDTRAWCETPDRPFTHGAGSVLSGYASYTRSANPHNLP